MIAYSWAEVRWTKLPEIGSRILFHFQMIQTSGIRKNTFIIKFSQEPKKKKKSFVLSCYSLTQHALNYSLSSILPSHIFNMACSDYISEEPRQQFTRIGETIVQKMLSKHNVHSTLF